MLASDSESGYSSMIKAIISEKFENILGWINYTISGTLVLADTIQYLDAHAAAFGVILGLMTFITQMICSIARVRIYAKSVNKNPDNG